MDIPFTKVIVDSRHAASGTSTNFDISLPETLVLPPNAAVFVTDVVISNTMPSLGSGSGSLRHMFYFIERVGGLTFLNRAHLDDSKMYNAISFASEIQDKMNGASIAPAADYTVLYDPDLGALKFTAASNATFFLANDDLLADPTCSGGV